MCIYAPKPTITPLHRKRERERERGGEEEEEKKKKKNEEQEKKTLTFIIFLTFGRNILGIICV
jgi:hypothetical protein